jgi:hypothetical protein
MRLMYTANNRGDTRTRNFLIGIIHLGKRNFFYSKSYFSLVNYSACLYLFSIDLVKDVYRVLQAKLNKKEIVLTGF